MRSASTGQLADLAAQDRRVDFRLYVANASDTLIEKTDQVLSWSLAANIEQNGATLSFKMIRETSSGSNAPMLATGAATDPIDVGRRVRLDVEVVEDDEAVGSWVTLFAGVVDEPAWGGDDGMLMVSCRDGWYEVQDAWIESEATYGATGGTAIATVMQSLITDTLGTGALTLRTVGSPTTVIYEYTQKRAALGDALREITNVNGWDLRPLWSTGDSDFRLTFSEPPRSNTTPDHTFTLNDYFTVTDIRRSSAGIRNVCLVEYATGSTVETSSTGSIAEHGRRFMYIDATQDPQITTTGVAANIGTAVVNDLAQPLAEKSVLARFFWPVELGDLYRFPRNDVHYASQQDMAVVAYQHDYVAGQAPTTTFMLRGTPSGGSLRWLKKATATKMAQEIVSGPQAITPTSVDRPPTVEVQPSQSGSTGTLDIVINDPDSTHNATSFESVSGGGDFDLSTDPATWSGYDASAPYGLTDTVTLVEGHTSVIAWAVRYNLGSGNAWLRGTHTFDADTVPDFTASLTQQGGSSVWLSHIGDEDLGAIRYAITTTGIPSTGAVAAGTVVAGRTANTEVKTDLAADETAYVRVRGYTTATGAGTASAEDWTGQIGDSVPDGSVDSAKLADGAVIASKMTSQAQSWMSTVQFYSNAYNNLTWTGGTIKLADGTSDTILTGSATLGSSAVRYIYYNGATGTLQVTTTYDDVLGDEDYVLMCVAKQPTDTSSTDCFFVPAIGAMGPGTIAINADQIAANSITSDKVKANAITAAKINVASLSAISADVGTLTAGLIQNTASTTFIDLDATGSATFIKGGTDFTLTATGSATFGGTVSASTFTANQINIAGNANVSGTGGVGIIGCSKIYDSAGTGSLSLVGGQIHFGTTFELYEPGVSAGVALGIQNGPKIGFHGTAPIAKPTVTGSRASNAALASLLTALANYGLITDSSS